MATHLLKNKQTEVVSPFTDKELENLKKHPELFNRFDIVSQKKEATPPELAALKNGKQNTAK